MWHAERHNCVARVYGIVDNNNSICIAVTDIKSIFTRVVLVTARIYMGTLKVLKLFWFEDFRGSCQWLNNFWSDLSAAGLGSLIFVRHVALRNNFEISCSDVPFETLRLIS